MENRFEVKVGEFEGPLDVLLRLVEEKKLHISQVSLAQVTDDFIAYLQKVKGKSKDQMASFVLVAATLMLIKSITLLPQLTVSEEEKHSIEDLERRLKLYQRVKELSEHVRSRFGREVIYAPLPREVTPVFAPSNELTTPSLLTVLKQVINNLPKAEIIPQAVVKKVISVEEVIKSLATRVQSTLKMSFKDFVKDQRERVNVIVSFLGMLELVKQGIVNVEQSTHFTDISIEAADPSVPRYI